MELGDTLRRVGPFAGGVTADVLSSERLRMFPPVTTREGIVSTSIHSASRQKIELSASQLIALAQTLATEPGDASIRLYMQRLHTQRLPTW